MAQKVEFKSHVAGQKHAPAHVTERLIMNDGAENMQSSSRGPEEKASNAKSGISFRAVGLSIVNLFRAIGFTTVNFSRAIQLSILDFLLCRLGHKRYKEPPKYILRRSWSIAMVRNLVHLIPIGGVITIVYLNIAGFYLGDSITSASALQFTAKLHEIFMVASLAQIMLYLVRNELISNDGLPFGALASGLQISQPNYLWSLELGGVVSSPSFRLWRKIRFLLLVVSCIVLAASVGPSSAITMIPRFGYWPAGVTHIWLNGTADQIFPTQISDQGIFASCANSSIASDPVTCPSSGWQNIAGLASFERYDLGPATSNWPNIDVLAYPDSEFLSSIQLPAQSALRTLYFCTNAGLECFDTLATTQHAAVANALQVIGLFWIDSVNNLENSRLDRFSNVLHTTESLQPFVDVDCDNGGAIEGPGDSGPIQISTRLFNGNTFINSTTNLTTVNGSEIFKTPGDSSQPRVAFIDLPSSLFNETSLGAVILHPRDPGNVIQTYTSCLIAAGWGFSQTNATSPPGVNHVGTLQRSVKSNGFDWPFREDSEKSHYFTSFPLRSISLSKAWAEYTNPFIPELNTSVFSAIASRSSPPDRSNSSSSFLDFDLESLRENILVSLITNGLSNWGSKFTLQGNITREPSQFYDDGLQNNGEPWILHNKDFFIVDPSEENNTTTTWLKLRVESYVEGYSYNHNGTIVKVTLGFLLAYALVATSFVICTCFWGISSSAWGSIGELIALAINSPASLNLKNTCAGIANLNTYKLMASANIGAPMDEEDDQHRRDGEEATDDSVDGAVAHVQLIFDDQGERGHSQTTKVKWNEKYG